MERLKIILFLMVLLIILVEFSLALRLLELLQSFYKLAGMDLAVNTSNNAWVTLRDLISLIVTNMSIRIRLQPFMGSIIWRIGQWEINQILSPLLQAINRSPVVFAEVDILLADNDITTIGYSGWLRYVIVRVAKYALDKEEGTDTSKLDAEIAFLSAQNSSHRTRQGCRHADTISNLKTRSGIWRH